MSKKIIEMIILVFVIIISFLLILKQWHSSFRDTLVDFVPSQMKFLEIDQSLVSYYIQGQGDSTVVFLSGWGTPSPYIDYLNLLDDLPQNYTGLIYERFGYGFSDETLRERTIENLVEELDLVLSDSGLEAPYIFVAHSLASTEVIAYSQVYSDKVKGIVLLDAGNPTLYSEIKPVTLMPKAQKIIGDIGIVRVLFNKFNFINSVISEQNDYSKNEWTEIERANNLRIVIEKVNNGFPTSNMIQELSLSQENAQKVASKKQKSQVPMIALTADMFGKQTENWLKSQSEFSEWTDNFIWKIVPESGHYLHQFQPEAVIDAIVQIDQ